MRWRRCRWRRARHLPARRTRPRPVLEAAPVRSPVDGPPARDVNDHRPIRYVSGDATAPDTTDPTMIAHVCNDIGGWGRGFVLALSARWPEPERRYRDWHRHRDTNDFALGAVQLVPVDAALWVANMIGQHGTRHSRGTPPVRYDAIHEALATVAGQAVELGASVHMPRIGCGLAGGSWDEVEPLILDTLVRAGVSTTVYDLP